MNSTKFLKKLFKSLLLFLSNTFVVRSRDKNWVKFGLLPRTSGNEYVVMYRSVAVLISICYLLKMQLAFILGWDCKWYLKYSADFWSEFDSKVVWFYSCLLGTCASLQNIVIPILMRNYWSEEWIQELDNSSLNQWLDPILMPTQITVFKHKMNSFSKNVFKVVNYLLRIMPLFGTMASMLYVFRNGLSLEIIVLGLLGWMSFVSVGMLYILYNAIPYANFVIFCYRANQLLVLLNKEFNSIADSHKNVHRLNSRLKQNIDLQTKLYRLIANCNRLYRHLTPCTLTFNLFAAVVLLYVSQEVDNFYERIIFLLLGFSEIILAAIPFLIGNLIYRQIKSIVKCFYKLICANNLRSLPISTKWQLLIMLEFLNSKRNRIGFTCLHWFRLNHTSLFSLSEPNVY